MRPVKQACSDTIEESISSTDDVAPQRKRAHHPAPAQLRSVDVWPATHSQWCRAAKKRAEAAAWPWALQHITVRSSTPLKEPEDRHQGRREGEVFESRKAPRGQNTPHPGGRPAPLLEVRPQVWAQRHSVVQVVGAVSELPTLDVPVPQLVDQLLSFLTALDSFVPQQVIEVPKISTLSRCPRTVLSVPQTAEQLVEVPTIISYSRVVRISERIAEQTVFPSRDERISERIVEQTVFPSRDERSSERVVEQLVDIPVYSRGASSRRGPHDSVPAVPGQTSTAFGGGLQDFLPGQYCVFWS